MSAKNVLKAAASWGMMVFYYSSAFMSSLLHLRPCSFILALSSCALSGNMPQNSMSGVMSTPAAIDKLRVRLSLEDIDG